MVIAVVTTKRFFLGERCALCRVEAATLSVWEKVLVRSSEYGMNGNFKGFMIV